MKRFFSSFTSSYKLHPKTMGGFLWAIVVFSPLCALWALTRLLTNYAVLASYLIGTNGGVVAITLSYILTPFAELVIYILAFHLLLRPSPSAPRFASGAHLCVPVIGILGMLIRIFLSSDLLGGGTVQVLDLVAEDLLFMGPLSLLSVSICIYLLVSRRVRAYYGEEPKEPDRKGPLPIYEGVSTMDLKNKQ